MEASTSSGEIPQRRKDALKGYRDVCIFVLLMFIFNRYVFLQKMRNHEAISESLKNRECDITLKTSQLHF